MATIDLTITNGTVANKSFAIPHTQEVGCKIFTNGTDIQYQPLRDDGTCVVDAIEGFTVVKTVPPSSKYFVDGGNILDFTNNGTNVDVPVDLNNYTFDSEPISFNEKFFVKPKIVDGIKIGEEFVIYNENEPKPTGICFNKTAKWAGVTL
jgi:hypothetical protein